MRLRIFDWATRWFWIVSFYQRIYSEPIFELAIYSPPRWARWIHVWRWEEIPIKQGEEVKANEQTDR